MFGGFPKTIIESQVLVHVRDMSEAGINMELWSFACRGKEYREGLAALSVFRKTFPARKVRLFRGVRPALPFSERLNAILFLWWMWRLDAQPAFVHARTEYPAMVAAIAKRVKKYCLIWDVRGDSLSEFREHVRQLSSLRKRLALLEVRIISRRLNIVSRQSDAAIFVSKDLRKLVGRNLPIEKTIIVPCLADESLFYFDLSLRENARAALGYRENDVVIAYIGSTAIWQCVPETITLMMQAMRANTSIKVLIVTPDRDIFEDAFTTDLRDRVCIKSGSLHEMNQYLNAADYGVLLRKANAINKVASPVKFAEYSLAGLTVVTTDAVEQVTEIGRQLANTIEPSDFIKVHVQGNVKPANRMGIAMKAQVLLGRKSYAEKLVWFYGSFL